MSFLARSAPIVARATKGQVIVPARSFSKGNVWLSDPGTFPVIGIIGGACIFCAGYFTWNLAKNPDIRIVKEKRRDTVIRNWT